MASLDFEAVWQLRFLKLGPDHQAQLALLAYRIKPQHRHISAVEGTQPFQAFNRGRLSSAVRPNHPEDLPLIHFQR